MVPEQTGSRLGVARVAEFDHLFSPSHDCIRKVLSREEISQHDMRRFLSGQTLLSIKP
jgi:hypothetical protein